MVTVKQKLAKVKPGENIQSTWTPSRGPSEPVLVIMRSILFLKDITAILHVLGCSVRNKPLLGLSTTPNPFTLGDGGPTEYRVRLTRKQWMRRRLRSPTALVEELLELIS
jgi:hypothetical protein